MTIASRALDPAFFGEPAWQSLVGATSSAAGTAVNFYGVRTDVAMQVGATGTPTGLICQLQVTIDFVNWYTTATFTLAGGNSLGDIVVGSSVPCLGARANLTTLSGGSAPAVTATITAK